MGKIIITKTIDETFGNMVHITNGIVELAATLDFGPRILHCSIVGMENMFYNDKRMKPINDIAFPEFGGDIMKVVGGHRLWISPEIMPRCYYPDNESVTLLESETGITLIAQIERFNNIQKAIDIKLNEYNSEVTLIHSVKNVGAWNAVYAPWAITVMDQGGVEVIPQTGRNTGYLGNRTIGLWPYAKMNDERVYWGDKYIVLRQDPNVDRAFKIATNNENNWAAYFNKNQLFVKSFEHVLDGYYPDFAECSFETYTNKDMLEIESLGQIVLVEPLKYAFHTEKWSVYKDDFVPDKDEEKIAEALSPYV